MPSINGAVLNLYAYEQTLVAACDRTDRKAAEMTDSASVPFSTGSPDSSDVTLILPDEIINKRNAAHVPTLLILLAIAAMVVVLAMTQNPIPLLILFVGSMVGPGWIRLAVGTIGRGHQSARPLAIVAKWSVPVPAVGCPASVSPASLLLVPG